MTALTRPAIVAVDLAIRCEQLNLDVTCITTYQGRVVVQLAFFHQARILAGRLGFKAPSDPTHIPGGMHCETTGVHEGVPVQITAYMRDDSTAYKAVPA